MDGTQARANGNAFAGEGHETTPPKQNQLGWGTPVVVGWATRLERNSGIGWDHGLGDVPKRIVAKILSPAMVGTSPPFGLRSFSTTERRCSVDVKIISDLRTSATKHDYRGWMSKNYPCFQRKEKCFLLTSPFIEPGYENLWPVPRFRGR